MRKLLLITLILHIFFLEGCYSCKSWHNLWGTGPVEPYGAEKFFFDSDCQPIAAAAPAPRPSPKAKPRPAPTKCGPYKVTRLYPCAECGVIKLEKTMPSEVQLNAPFTYDIKVTNLTNVMVSDVVVTENTPANFKFKSASPTATEDENKLMWSTASLEAGESQRITVSGMATNTDCLKHCATVTYTIPACANVAVVQPKLRLTKSAPAEVLLCDPIPIKMVVTNTGTGLAKDVKVTDTLPSGLVTSDGMSRLVFDAGTLTSGQSKTFAANLKASKTGKYVNTAMASSAGGLEAEASTTTVVRQPVLTITKSGPEKRYLGRAVTYEIMIANKGDAPAEELVVEDAVPSGAEYVSASDGGKMAAGKVVWNLGTLSAGRSRTVSMTVMPNSAGIVVNTAMARATCAAGVSTTARTSVEGIPAVLLEVIDIDDPIEIGSNTTYVIIATNQGSSPGTNIKIVCTLEENEQYVSSSGATRGSAVGNTVTFAPLPNLAPKAKATWQVVVKAVTPGDVRFKVTMNTDQITRPVEETEATHLYE